MATLVEEDMSADLDSIESDSSPKHELYDIPFFELQKMREEIGTKKFDALLSTSSSERHRECTPTRNVSTSSKWRRIDKSKPLEISSKRRVPRFKKNPKEPNSGNPVDPRFDEKCGNFNESLFKKSYHFLSDVRTREKDLVRKELKKERGKNRRIELSRLLNQMDTREASEKKAEQTKSLQREHKKIEREKQKAGKRPYYFKKSVSRKIDLAQKYKRLKKEGRLEKFMKKKRKKNAQRDRKRLPN